MFVFVTLPEGRDATYLLPRALEQGVAFVPGNRSTWTAADGTRSG